MSDSTLDLLADAIDPQLYLETERERTPAKIQGVFRGIDQLTKEFLIPSVGEVLTRFDLPMASFTATHKDLWSFDPTKIASIISEENHKRMVTSFSGSAQIDRGAWWLDDYTHTRSRLSLRTVFINLSESPIFVSIYVS